MAIFKCKMCGGALEINNNETVAVCEYCGTKQTLPKSNDEVVSNLFNRANSLRLKCEFDKAEQVYEKILEIDNTEAEAHWGIVLCKYGIEYVEDPKTYTRIPTCHRTSYDSILADSAYLSAVANADGYQKVIYEEEAKKINDIQRGILSIVKNEKPFDVFICYKETDESGQRTVDSTIANDIYHQLTNEGFKVFYAAITLEDKLGEAYEPYIFAALNSAKVMLVIGTKPEYFEAVWVKNEWSRFLKLIKTDRSKLLIPCYRNMDAYDLPEEFSHLQSQDMSKIGFINDIEHGIKKVLAKDTSKVESAVVTQATTNIAPLLKRAFMFLEDGDWASADEYCEKVLDLDPECAMAYLAKVLVSFKINRIEELSKIREEYFNDKNYIKAIRYANEKTKAELNEYLNKWKEKRYKIAASIMENAKSAEEYRNAAEIFKNIIDYKDSKIQYDNCLSQIDIIQNLINKQKAIIKEIDKRKIILEELERKQKTIETKCVAEQNRESMIKRTINSHSMNTLILSILNITLPLILFIILLNSSEQPSDFEAIFGALSMVGSFCCYLAFIIYWSRFTLKILKKNVLVFLLRIVLSIFVPLVASLIAINECKKIKKIDIDSNSNELIQKYLDELRQYQDKINSVKSEIQHLSTQINQIGNLNPSTEMRVDDFNNSVAVESKDELFVQAGNYVVEMGKATTTMLQRQFKLGYARAARLLDSLEESGIVGPFVESQPRQVLLSKEQWEQLRNNYL